jgi:hypothetical protein
LPARVAEELHPVIENVIDELDHWFGVSAGAQCLRRDLTAVDRC